MQLANRYDDRRNAGQALAALLAPLSGRPEVVVVGLPRGGVIVAAEVAEALGAPLDIYPVRKLSAPAQPEFGIGALGAGAVQVLDERLVSEWQISRDEIEEIVAEQQQELERQERFFRQFQPEQPLAKRVVILVDDGAATGYTMVAAAAGLRTKSPARVVVAVPVGSFEACAQLAEVADDVICPLQPTPFHAVGLWYVHFEPVTEDDAVQRLVAANVATRSSRS